MKEPKPRYEISFNMLIRKADTYGAPEESVTLTECVPAGDDPVEALRKAVNREFRRKFASLELVGEEEGAIL